LRGSADHEADSAFRASRPARSKSPERTAASAWSEARGECDRAIEGRHGLRVAPVCQLEAAQIPERVDL
jgi:hypothetical protein